MDGPNRLWIYPSLGIISWTFNVKSHWRRLFDAVSNQFFARAPVRDTAKFQKFGYKHLTTLMGAIYWQSSSFVTLMEFKAVVMIEILVAYIAYTTYRTNRIDSECCRDWMHARSSPKYFWATTTINYVVFISGELGASRRMKIVANEWFICISQPPVSTLEIPFGYLRYHGASFFNIPCVSTDPPPQRVSDTSA